MKIRLMKQTLLLSVWLFIGLSVHAQTHEVHAIDSKLNKALEQDLSTADQLGVIASAAEEWKQLMLTSYGELEKQLPADVGTALKQSQRTWDLFYRQERTIITRLYENTEGTMFKPLEALDKMRLLKDRALQLDALLSAWQMRNQ